MDPTFPDVESYASRNRETDLVGAHLSKRGREQRSMAVMATLAACAIAGAAIWAAGARGPSAGIGAFDYEQHAPHSAPAKPPRG